MSRFKFLAGMAAMFFMGLGAPAAAQDCDIMHALQIDVKDGRFKVFLNGVYLYEDDDKLIKHARGFNAWQVQGENLVRVEFDGKAGDFSVIRACRGAFPDKNGDFPDADTVGEAKFDGTASKDMRFHREAPVGAEYMKAEIAGDDGLMEAIKKLQDAAASGDVDTVMAMHAPMFRDAERRGMSLDWLTTYMRDILSKNPVDIATGLVAKPIMGGRAYQVLNAEQKSAISLNAVYKDTKVFWNSGTFWARFDGKWLILAL